MKYEKNDWIKRLNDLEKASINKIDNHASKLNKENRKILQGVITSYKDYIKHFINLTIAEVHELYKNQLVDGHDILNSLATSIQKDVFSRATTICADIDNIVSGQNDKLQKVDVSSITDLNKVKVNYNFHHLSKNQSNNTPKTNLKIGDTVHATDNGNSNYGTIIAISNNHATVKFVNNEKETQATVDISLSDLEKVEKAVYDKIKQKSKKSSDKIEKKKEEAEKKAEKVEEEAEKAKESIIEIVKKKYESIKDNYKTEVAAVVIAIASYSILYTILKRSNKILSVFNVLAVVKEAKLQYAEADTKKRIIIAVAAAGIISGLATFGVSLIKKITKKQE